VAWLVLLVPAVTIASATESTALILAPYLIAGVVLGAVRQGIDVLLLRLLAASTAPYVAAVVADFRQGHWACGGPVACVQIAVLGLIAVALIGVIELGLVAVPAAIVWNRGLVSLKPERTWPVPRALSQWVLVLVCVVFGFIILGLLLGIPFPG
jgi:hypothetical protein